MVMYSPVVVAPSYSGIMAIASLSEVHAESRQQRAVHRDAVVERGGQLTLRSPSRAVQRILQITGVDRIVTIQP